MKLRQLVAAGGVSALLVAGLAAVPEAGAALSSKPAETFATDGAVYAIASTPSAIYIGGDFTQVGPPTGAGVGIDAVSAKSTGLPQIIGGEVLSVAKDGHGGFYVGGDFDYAGGRPRNNLVHILANGTVDRGFDPRPDGPVTALSVSGSIVYVGGHFTSIGGKRRKSLAALRSSDGTATRFNPKPKITKGLADISALKSFGSRLYVGGRFGWIGGERRKNLAALHVSTGKPTNWNPRVTHKDPAGRVNAIVVAKRRVYVGGSFSKVGKKRRRNIAVIGRDTGRAKPWDPSADDDVLDLAVSGSRIYVAGSFGAIGGQTRAGIAALKARGGRATNWDPSGGHKLRVDAVALSGSRVYVAGYFTSIGGQARAGLAALDRSTDHVMPWNPNPSRPAVTALAVSGSTVYAGGSFN